MKTTPITDTAELVTPIIEQPARWAKCIRVRHRGIYIRSTDLVEALGAMAVEPVHLVINWEYLERAARQLLETGVQDTFGDPPRPLAELADLLKLAADRNPFKEADKAAAAASEAPHHDAAPAVPR
jgi:hypothetical protein